MDLVKNNFFSSRKIGYQGNKIHFIEDFQTEVDFLLKFDGFWEGFLGVGGMSPAPFGNVVKLFFGDQKLQFSNWCLKIL